MPKKPTPQVRPDAPEPELTPEQKAAALTRKWKDRNLAETLDALETGTDAFLVGPHPHDIEGPSSR